MSDSSMSAQSGYVQGAQYKLDEVRDYLGQMQRAIEGKDREIAMLRESRKSDRQRAMYVWRDGSIDFGAPIRMDDMSKTNYGETKRVVYRARMRKLDYFARAGDIAAVAPDPAYSFQLLALVGDTYVYGEV